MDSAPHAPVDETRIETRPGALRGSALDGVRRFLGVPFAAPPVGPLRFALPQTPAPWSGERDATQRGHIAPQPTPSPGEMEKVLPGLDIQPLIGGDQVQGDDFLVLNIWTPTGAPSGLPVMVFIHGGAFTGGAGAADVYDGTAFARAGIVCVTINYRLGVEGFLPIPGAPTNLGLRDQLFALEWVRDNIAAFGGDAGNVTVFGESAGAMSVANLVASPLAKGLFKRAIVQSGHGDMVRPIPIAQRLVKKLAKVLRVQPTIEGFRSRSFAECVAGLRKVSLPTTNIDLRNPDKREPAFGLSRFLPVYGDDVLPEHPMIALKNGSGADIELIVGTNSEEMNLYFVPSGVRRKIGSFLAHFVTGKAEPKAKEVLRAYGIKQKGRRPGDAFTEALTDLVFRLPARRFAAAHTGRTYVYDFGWRSTAYDGTLGACHAIELPFVFNTLHTVNGARGLAGANPPQALADHMNAIWVGFAKTGALPWGEYTAETRLVYRPELGVAEREPPMPAEFYRPVKDNHSMYLEKFKLTDRVAVITGGASGIGLATAEALAEAGARVIIADRDQNAIDSARAALSRKSFHVDGVLMDVTDAARVSAVADEIVAREARVDVLINNAGIARSETAAEDVADEHWLNVLDVNLNGTFWCARAFGRHMLARGAGSIVNVGSMSGFIVNRPQPQSYYNASKAAVHQLTKSLAAEWAARGVRVNAVAPTYIRTPLNEFADKTGDMYRRWIDGTPMRRLGEPEEVASAILFLASDAASLMTGSVVLVDGGYSCW